MIKDEGNGDPAKPQSQGGEREQPDVAHLKQTTVKGQTDKQKMSSLQQTTFFLVAAHLKQTTVKRQTNKLTSNYERTNKQKTNVFPATNNKCFSCSSLQTKSCERTNKCLPCNKQQMC